MHCPSDLDAKGHEIPESDFRCNLGGLVIVWNPSESVVAFQTKHGPRKITRNRRFGKKRELLHIIMQLNCVFRFWWHSQA
jgi:hypothetical protein